jgi:hypothetical protein
MNGAPGVLIQGYCGASGFLRIGCGVVFESLLVDGHHLYVGDAIDEPGQDGAQILRQK